MNNAFAQSFVAETRQQFRYYKLLSEQALEQLSDSQLHLVIGKNGNSVAVIVQHMSGNMLSRWTDFLNSDGEKPNRNRDTEFVDLSLSRQELLAKWSSAWECLFAALHSLEEKDFFKTVRVRGEEISAVGAIQRQLAHQAGHAMQIVLLAKTLLGSNWKNLSVPVDESEAFNKKLGYDPKD